MYLKHNVKLAPYIWNWYAWSHLIPPHTAAMNIAERHIKIMESFIDFPDMHYQAINSRGMMGGPFINLSSEKKSQISDLLQKTKQDCLPLLALNASIKEFDILLQNNAQGASLEQFYSLLPLSLKGMVELVYDLHNHPQINFIEPILYHQYYNTSSQSIILSEILNDKRPFCLSTPHVDSDKELEIKIPFSSETIDTLMKMKLAPGNPEHLLDELLIKEKDMGLFQSLFTHNPPPITNGDVEFTDSGVRIRYFGHACVLVQTKDISVLIDPVLGYNYDGQQTDRFTYLDLPKTIDYVLITHNHQDHCLFEVLLQLRHRIKNIVVPASNNGSLADPSMKLILSSLGFTHIFSMHPFDEISLGSYGKITALPFLGEHGDLDVRTKLAYHMVMCDLKLIFLADSNNLDNQIYHFLFEYVGAIDMLFIGMECVGAPVSWLYGPLFSKPLSREHDQSRRLSGSNCLKALEIIKQSKCKEVCVYAMGMEPWLSYIMAVDYKSDSPPIIESNKLISYCHEQGLKAERLFGKRAWLFPKGKYQLNDIKAEVASNVI